MKPPDPSKTRVARWVIIAAAVLLTGANLMALVGDDRETTQSVLDRYTKLIRADGPPTTQPADDGEKGKPKEKDARAERIIARHLFSPDPPKAQWSATVSGVLGDTAYMDGANAVQVGGDYKGAKLTAIGPDWVSFDYQGATHKLHVFGSGGTPSPPSGPSGPSEPPRPMTVRPGPSSQPSPVVQAAPSPSPPSSTSRFAGMSPEMMARIKEQFASLSPEQKAEALEQLSAEDRELVSKW